MKKILLTLAVTGLVAGCNSTGSSSSEPALSSDEEKVSYGMGLMVSQRMKGDIPDLQMEQFVQGIEDGMGEEGEARMTREEIQAAVQSYQRKMQSAQQEERSGQAQRNKEAGEEFLAENAEREEVTTTASGLQYEVIEEGDGERPTARDRVRVHYTGELISGEVFDSSRQRGEPVTFGLNQVIPGWTEGLQQMPEGSRYRLYIPADLAYGPGGNQSIGPNETLVFDVELLEINP